jgi:histidyl-tRNA synthetase
MNSIGCKVCRPKYLEDLKQYYVSHVGGLCPDCKTRMEKNTLRLLDCKKPFCQDVADKAPKSSDYLCQECGDHFESVKKHLGVLTIPFQINHRLVRGLDYYTRTVFEVHPPEETAQSALGGGGRYDNLIEQLGGKPTPAMGFASGMERVILNLKKQEVEVLDLPKPKLFVACLGDEAKLAATRLVSNLRQQGISAIMATGNRSLKAQLRQADGFAIGNVAIIGEDEIENHAVTLRNMATGEQQTVAIDELSGLLR